MVKMFSRTQGDTLTITSFVNQQSERYKNAMMAENKGEVSKQ